MRSAQPQTRGQKKFRRPLADDLQVSRLNNGKENERLDPVKNPDRPAIQEDPPRSLSDRDSDSDQEVGGNRWIPPTRRIAFRPELVRPVLEPPPFPHAMHDDRISALRPAEKNHVP